MGEVAKGNKSKTVVSKAGEQTLEGDSGCAIDTESYSRENFVDSFGTTRGFLEKHQRI